jgi:hypothetical protein
MITEKELLQAIRECEAEPITPSKIGKLADFYIIYDHLFGAPYEADYSYSNKVGNPTIETSSDTEFLKAVNGKPSNKVWAILDEIMEVVKTLHPKMYDKAIDKISDL